MSELLFFTALITCAIVSLGSYHVGFCRGRDRGWLDRQDELWREERRRRDAAGRFRSTKLIVRHL